MAWLCVVICLCTACYRRWPSVHGLHQRIGRHSGCNRLLSIPCPEHICPEALSAQLRIKSQALKKVCVGASGDFPKSCFGFNTRKSRCRTTLRLRFELLKRFPSSALHDVKCVPFVQLFAPTMIALIVRLWNLRPPFVLGPGCYGRSSLLWFWLCAVCMMG